MLEKIRGKPSDIYADLVSSAKLTEAHREDLLIKRAITSNSCTQLKLKSCGEYLRPIIESIKLKYSLQDVLKSGIIYNNEQPVKHLLDDTKILIPYLMEDGENIFYIKCHKQGNLPNIGIEPYAPYLMRPQVTMIGGTPPYVVICESEFKAIVLWQIGFKAIAINGVNAMAGEHLHKLKRYIEEHDRVIVLFDNEIQDDPSLPTFKSEQYKRHAHSVWGYKIAKRIERFFTKPIKEADGKTVYIKPSVSIATLPAHWIDGDGKIDCDSAMAKGKGIEQFRIVMADALDPETYKNRLEVPQEDKGWVFRRLEQENRSFIYYERNGGYWYDRMAKDATAGIPEQLSNFVIRHKNTIIKDGETFREIYLKNNLHDISESFVLNAKQCANYKDFKAHCLGRGDFMWFGSEKMFNRVIEGLFLEHESAPIHILDQCGRSEDAKAWVFDNMILKDDGNILVKETSQDKKTFNDRSISYRILPLKSGGFIPSLSTKEINVKEVFDHMVACWGIEGVEGFAFVISCLFSFEVFRVTQAFPILMIHGEREAGKSALTDILAAIAGFNRDASSQNISDTTNVALGRIMNYYSSLPVRFDEFRNDDQKTQMKTSMLRSLYNRQGASKGIRETFGIREVNVKGCFILTGEEPPQDPALFSRVIPLHIRGIKNTITATSLKYLYEHLPELSYITYYILKDFQKNKAKFAEDFQATIFGLKQTMQKSATYNPRAINHYAMIMAALGLLFDIEDLKPIQSKIFNNFTYNVEAQKAESVVYRFFTDIFGMKNMGEPINRYINKPYSSHYGVIYLKAVHELYSQFRSRHGGIKQLCSEATIRSYLRAKPYCPSTCTKAFVESSGGISVNCVVIDLTHPECPSDLKDLFQNISVGLTNVIEDTEDEKKIESGLYNPNS